MVARTGTVTAVAAALAVAAAGCEDPAPEVASAGTLAVLSAVADDVVRPAVERFAARAGELELARGEDLRAAWRDASDVWQELEVLRIGPAGEAGIVIGGEDLGDEAYSWPLSNPCRIDQEVVEQGYLAPDFFEAEHVNVYGLDAMDYLLFAPADETICTPQIAIREDGRWDALGAEEVRARRDAYAVAVAGELNRTAQRLLAAWDPEEGDFGTALADPGGARSPYPDFGRALDDVYRALFYLDLVSKDLKLAKPAGILGCSSPTCPTAVESRWGGRSLEHLLANVRAGAALAAAFDPLLAERGASAIGSSLAAALQAATTALQGVPGDLATAVTSDAASVQAAHAALKEATDMLKGPFLTVLSLTLPYEGAGDND